MVKSCADSAGGLGIFEYMLDPMFFVGNIISGSLKNAKVLLLLLIQFLLGQSAMPILQFLLGHGVGILHFGIFSHFYFLEQWL